jgi:hypothetical protein
MTVDGVASLVQLQVWVPEDDLWATIRAVAPTEEDWVQPQLIATFEPEQVWSIDVAFEAEAVASLAQS